MNTQRVSGSDPADATGATGAGTASAPHAESAEDASALVDIAEAVQHLARKLSARVPADDGLDPLTPLETLVLQSIQRNPGIAPSALAQNLRIQRSNTSVAVRRLEELGLVVRARDPQDGRRIGLELTDKARTNLRRIQAAWQHLLGTGEGAGAGPSPTDLLTTARTLQALDAHLAETHVVPPVPYHR
ncbi:MarR family transcriptional regulator [Brevibacterium sp. 91QC2O2]|uniref:MarR family winged helix-turn-helix transcriptional regulator n=1 Tax=Brevibacterium TaxID=1696 RepID=UPI00211CE0CA|nr:MULTISPECIES: MarR family transcriptional regulator [unclassified Brevibacterium]MCQ9367248.1 MarR family transcriptional regulator [Brevibacterium sp. 91QC2O2]MCQ9385616.1 MarR family transcriptional regulator [Brevibacterium sp. 68QC2CO]